MYDMVCMGSFTYQPFTQMHVCMLLLHICCPSDAAFGRLYA